MSNVKVAVRVRPLSQREKDGNGKSIVEVHGDSLSILNAKVDQSSDYGDSREKVKHFTFDYCYDSSGAPQTPGYASQQLVFQDLGTEILQAAFEGYNACLFAYGQTSTGKTYTMMGTRDDFGIIPRICEGLFSHVDDCLSENVTFRVDISYLEIYNERVKDLLRPSLYKAKEKFTLKVREHPKEGPYVQDLSSHCVKDNSEIQELLDRGNESRTTASTYMHDRSSRSHAIVTISFTQAKLEEDLPHEVVSKIHLVDLAGSERADPNFSDNYKGRLKEGANINRSLVTLGNVIKALAERSLLSWSADNLGSTQSFLSATDTSPKRLRLPYIPYRDSVLTWLLKDSLGGNSKTIMIATITPANLYYSETISTLRYAQRAKSIINKPKINEDPNVSLIRELRQEIFRLRDLLKSAQMGGSQMSELNMLVQMHDMMTETQKGNPQQVSSAAGSALAEKLLDHENMAKMLTQTWQNKWTETHDIMKESDLSIRGLKHSSSMGVMIESQMPHLVGMDDDILSTGVTIYHLKDGKTLVGRADAGRPQDIILRGPAVKEEHCFFKTLYGTVTMHPNRGAHCTVNGVECKEPVTLKQGDYVLLGKTNMFRFNNPAEAAKLRERRQSLNSSRDELSYEGSMESLDPDESDPYSYYNRRPFHPLYGPNYASPEICLQLERQYRSESERINQAKKELEKLRDDHQRAEELRREREEELWRIHEEHRAEIQREKEKVLRMKEETQAQRDKAEAEIEYARECLQKEREAFNEKLQRELKGLQTPGPVSGVVTQTDLETPQHIKEVINSCKRSGWGRVKDLLHGELLSKLHHREAEERLRKQSVDLEEQYAMSQREIQQQLGKIKETEQEYKSEDAEHYQEMASKMKEIDNLAEREEQLELYIEETQDLLMVGVDQPHPLRSACSEEVLTVLSPPDRGFPTRTSSLMALPRGSEGDLPSCSNRLSTMLCGQSMEESSNSLFEGSEASVDLSSSVDEGSDNSQRKLNAKSEKLVKTAKTVTDRLYKAPEPKFKYQPKSRQLPRSSGATYDSSVRNRDRRSPISPARESPSRGTSSRVSPGRAKSDSPKSTPRTTPSPRQTPERQLDGNKESRKNKRTDKDSKSSDEKASANTAKNSGKTANVDSNTSGNTKGALSRNSLSAGDLAGIRGRRQSPTGSHGDISERKLSPSARKRDSDNKTLSPNPDSGGRKFVPRLRHITSASSLANVPEAIAEEAEPAEPEQKSTSQVVVKRRKKRPQVDGDEFRRHSEPLGEELAEAFDKYTQDFEQMEWQRTGSTNLEARGNILNWSGSFPLDVPYSIPGSTSSDDGEHQREGNVDSENDVQNNVVPTIYVQEYDNLDEHRLSREPSVYSETGSTVSTVSDPSTVVETEMDESERVVFMEGVETLSDEEYQPWQRDQEQSSELQKPGSKRDHDVDSDSSQTLLVKVARTDDDNDISTNLSDNLTTSQLPGGHIPGKGSSDTVSLSSDSLDDSKSIDSLECPKQRMESLNDEDSLDDSLDESDPQKSDTMTSQTSVMFLSDSTSTELLTSCDGLDMPDDLASSGRSEQNIPPQSDQSPLTEQESETVTLAGINEPDVPQDTECSQEATEAICLKESDPVNIENVDSLSRKDVQTQDSSQSEEDHKTNKTKAHILSSETNEMHNSQQPTPLDYHCAPSSSSETSATVTNLNISNPQDISSAENKVPTSLRDMEVPSSQDKDSHSNPDDSIKVGPNEALTQSEQTTAGTHSTDTGPTVIDTHTQTLAEYPRKQSSQDIEGQDNISESSPQTETEHSHPVTQEEGSITDSQGTGVISDSPKKSQIASVSTQVDTDSDFKTSWTADKSCDGTPIELTDRASQVNITEPLTKDASIVTGVAIQTDALFHPITDDTMEKDIKPEDTEQEAMEAVALVAESGAPRNEARLFLNKSNLEDGPSKTVGVCTSPSLLCSHEDVQSCSNDSLQEVKEQLQELQEVLEGHIGIPARGAYTVSPQLSSARRAVRQRAMIQRNGRLESGESDGTDHLAETTEPTGSQSKSCSRPTSGSRRRKRANLKPYKKSGKCPYCQSSEEYQLTTESESLHSDTADISKGEEPSQPDLSSDGEKSHDAAAEDDDNGIRHCDNGNHSEKCSNRHCSENSEKSIPKSGSVSSLNSEVEKYCSVLQELDDKEQNASEDNLETSMSTNHRPQDGTARRPQKLRSDMNSVDSSYGSVGKPGSRATSETRDSEQQTDLSSVDSPLMSPMSSLHSSLRSPRPGIHQLNISPVSVWSSDKSSSSPRKARASGGLNTPTGRRTPRKHKTSSTLEMACTDVWSTETVDPSSPPPYASGTLDSDVSSEEDNCYSLETETVSPQSPTSSDRFFDHGSFILESPPSGRAIPIQSPIRYEVTVKEEETNVFYNVNKVEYKTYGLNSPTLSTTIPETININVTNTDTKRTENHDEHVSHENVVFSRTDTESPTHAIVSERNYRGSSNVSNEDGHHVENQTQNEYGNSYVEEMRPPLNVQLSEDPRGLKSLTSPTESDCTSDYGTMIGDGRRGNTSFMSDSADDLDSLPGGRSFSKSSSTPRSKVTEYNAVGEQTVLNPQHEGLESIQPAGQNLHAVSPPPRRMGRTRCTESSPPSEMASIAVRPSSAMDVLRNLIENPISTRDDADHSDEYDPDRKYFVEEICDEIHSSSSSSYTTPQQSPRPEEAEKAKTSTEPQTASEKTDKLPLAAVFRNLQMVTVNTESLEPKTTNKKQTKDDGNLHRELKRELQQKLASLQRRVRSLSDSAISSDYHTDGDSTTVSPRGSRLYESDKIFRFGAESLAPVEVRTSQTEAPQVPAEVLNAKSLEIENKSARKSPFKDSGNVFDDEESSDQGKTEGKKENYSKTETSDQEVSDMMEKQSQQPSKVPIEVTSSSEESDSDVRGETNSHRSLSPGEILLDEFDASEQQETFDEEQEIIDADEEHRRRYKNIKEKSPSMSDIASENHEEIRRSMSETCMDQFEETKEDNANSSNDSIVFVFMGQSHSKDSMEQLKSFTSKQPEYNILSSNEVLEDSGDDSDEDDRSSNRDSIIQNEDAAEVRESYRRRHRSHTDIDDDDKPLRHKFGIDENVLPIPTRSMSSDNLPKQSLSKHKIHRSRSASLLEVNSKIEVADDSSNNEGIFPPCVETSERESQNMSEARDSTSAEIGDSDFSLTELDTPRVGEGVCEDMQYSRFPHHHDHPHDTHQHTDYSSTEKPRNEVGTDQKEESPRTQAKDHKVLPSLVSPYRGKSAEDLSRNKPPELHLSKEAENWQNMSSMVIENNALLQNLQQKFPGEYQCKSEDLATRRDDTTQTSDSLQDLEDSSTQTDVSFLAFEMSETDTTDIHPENTSEMDENIITKKLVPVKETVNFFDRLSREPSPVKHNNTEASSQKKKDQPKKEKPDVSASDKRELESEYSYPNLSASNSEMEKLKEEQEKMMEKFRAAAENRKRMTEKLRQEAKPPVHEEFVAKEANRQQSFPHKINIQSPKQGRLQDKDYKVKDSSQTPVNEQGIKNTATKQNGELTSSDNTETVEDVLSDDEGCITPPTSPVTIETEIPSDDISVPLRSRLQHLNRESSTHAMVNGDSDTTDGRHQNFHQNGQSDLKLDLSAITGSDSSQPITNFNNHQIKQKLDKLHKERVQIIELLSLNYLPASFTVELLEAKLNYCIGQTDLLLKSLEEHWDSDDERHRTIHHPHITREYLSMYRDELQQSKSDIEICRERMTRKQGTGRGRTKGRNRDVLKMRRNAEIEAFKVERMLELQNYQRSKTLHNLNNSVHESLPDRGSRSVSPTSSVHSSSQYMTPKQHKDHLVGLRKELVKHTEDKEFLSRMSRSSSPLHHRTSSHPSRLLHHDYLSPRSASTQDRLYDQESCDNDYYSVYSPRDNNLSPRNSYHNRQLAFSPRIAFSVADELPSCMDYGYSTYLVPPQGRDSPRSVSSDTKPPSNTLNSPTQMSTGSISPEPRYRPVSEQSFDHRPDTRTYYTGSESRQLLHEIEQIRLQNRSEIRRAQHILDSYSKKPSSVREAHLSADRLSSTPRRPYSSYSDYASDLLDASHRSMSGTLSGSYELYDAEVSGLTSRYRPQSPASVISDIEGFDPLRTRPIQSRDIKAKLKRRHTTRR